MKASSLEDLATVPYRELNIADFKAGSLPEDIKIWSDKLNAHTAIIIRPVKDVKLLVSATRMNGRPVFVGTTEGLAFEAVMVPEKSWWSRRIPASRRPYVLQHEQIHFALMEIAARRLTSNVQKKADGMVVFGGSSHEVAKSMQDAISRMIEEARQEIFKEHMAFDEDTSGYFVPGVQQKWADKVNSELRKLSP